VRPNVGRYRKLAKELLKACATDAAHAEADAIRRWAETWVNSILELSALTPAAEMPVDVEEWVSGMTAFAQRRLAAAGKLADAQFVIARSHGFESWPRFIKMLEALDGGTRDGQFEAAADAIVAGELLTLRRLLNENPSLIHQRSMREHGATLLHYIAANGVEGYRQKTPANVVEITDVLLKAGAQVNATARMYSSDCTALELVATSGHPERAGVQEALLALLLHYGARLEKLSKDRKTGSIVDACLANGRMQAAMFLADRGASVGLPEAAGLGFLDVLKRFFHDDKQHAGKEEIQQAFFYACQFGRYDVVEFLISKGVDLEAGDHNGQTGLHWAAAGGHADIAKLLLRLSARLDLTNSYGGTPLGQGLWSSERSNDPARYIELLDVMISAGAAIPHGYAPHHPALLAWWMKRYMLEDRF
jgi:ankyrin repeat protein